MLKEVRVLGAVYTDDGVDCYRVRFTRDNGQTERLIPKNAFMEADFWGDTVAGETEIVIQYRK